MVLTEDSIKRGSGFLFILSMFIVLCNVNTKCIASAQKTGTDGIILQVSEKDALSIAERYYRLADPKMEADFIAEYKRIVSTPPVFDGKAVDTALCKANSAMVAALISFTDAKYFYLALSQAVFSYDPHNVVAATNAASAIATYMDELLLNKTLSKTMESELLQDALKMYSYAITLSAPGSIYSAKSIVPLNCMGNLLLDTKRFDDAFALFNTAHSIDSSDYTSVMGMYNCYMAQKRYKDALDLISDHAKFSPVFTRATSQLTKGLSQDEAENETDQTTESSLEEKIALVNKINPATTADFVEALDRNTAEKIRKDVKSIQDRMIIKAPNIDYILMIKNYQNMSREAGQSALMALADQIKELGLNTVGYETEAMVKNQIDMLKQFGANVDLGFDVENIQEIINDAIKNPEKYENWNPDVKISGINKIAGRAEQHRKEMNTAISKARAGDATAVYEKLAGSSPEYQVMLLNPYSYANPNDLLIQQQNVLALSKKKRAYQSYMRLVNVNAGSTIAEIAQLYQAKFVPLTMEYQNKLLELQESDMDDDRRRVLIHKLHVEYFPKFNNLGRPYWNQATEMAAVAYKKIQKNFGPAYSELMKHVMLISDTDVRDHLEEDITSNLMTDIKTAMTNVLTAYSIAQYFDPALCDCDLDEIRELKEKIEEEAHRLANEQIKKNIQDKKNFEQGILDENSEYYKEFIAKYEYEIDVGFLKSKVNPYKSVSGFGIDLSFIGVNFSIATNHLRNTTTYDGGINISGGVMKEGPGPSLKSGIGFTAVKGSDGTFSAKDVDIRASVEGSLNLGVVSLTGGIEASAVRGTREYANIGVTGDKYLDDFKEQDKRFKLLPGVGKEIWSGSYSEN